MAEYLEEGLGRSVPHAVLASWMDIGDECRSVLRPHLDIFRGYSAPENPAIVLPELFATGILVNDDDATSLLGKYRDLLADIDQAPMASSNGSKEEFLGALADYANYYDLIAAMRVPLDEPFLVKIAERRDLELSAFGNRGVQELVIADAQTNHVTFKIPDPNVRIRDFRATKPGSKAYSYGAFQSREDPQNRAFYAHDPDRDYRVHLSFQLGLLRRLQLVPYFAALLLALLVSALWLERPTDLKTLAIVVGPAALGASILLSREPSTLGSRLRTTSSLTVAAALLALVGSAGVLYACGALDVWDREDRPTRDGPRHTDPNDQRRHQPGRHHQNDETVVPKQ